jgi:hypothetical protein
MYATVQLTFNKKDFESLSQMIRAKCDLHDVEVVTRGSGNSSDSTEGTAKGNAVGGVGGDVGGGGVDGVGEDSGGEADGDSQAMGGGPANMEVSYADQLYAENGDDYDDYGNAEPGGAHNPMLPTPPPPQMGAGGTTTTVPVPRLTDKNHVLALYKKLAKVRERVTTRASQRSSKAIGNVSLRALAEHVPETLDQFACILDMERAEEYGQAFVDRIKKYVELGVSFAERETERERQRERDRDKESARARATVKMKSLCVPCACHVDTE